MTGLPQSHLLLHYYSYAEITTLCSPQTQALQKEEMNVFNSVLNQCKTMDKSMQRKHYTNKQKIIKDIWRVRKLDLLVLI